MNNSISDRVIIIRVSQKYHETMSKEELFEITRGVWRIGPRRENAEFAFSVYQGVVQEVYKIHSWHPAGTLTYKTRTKKDVTREGRWEFEGELADNNIRRKYVGIDVKDYLPRHASNPLNT